MLSSTSLPASNLDCSAAKRAPLTEEHFLSRLDEMRDRLKDANTKIAALSTEVDNLKLGGKDKDARIRSLLKRNQDLERRLGQQDLGELVSSEKYFLVNVNQANLSLNNILFRKCQ